MPPCRRSKRVLTTRPTARSQPRRAPAPTCAAGWTAGAIEAARQSWRLTGATRRSRSRARRTGPRRVRPALRPRRGPRVRRGRTRCARSAACLASRSTVERTACMVERRRCRRCREQARFRELTGTGTNGGVQGTRTPAVLAFWRSFFLSYRSWAGQGKGSTDRCGRWAGGWR